MRDLNDDLVKGIFDNIRNLSLTALVIATGVILTRQGIDEAYDWYQIVVGAATIIIGFGLFSLNATHALKKLQEANLAKYSFVFVSVVYVMITIEFVGELWNGKLANWLQCV